MCLVASHDAHAFTTAGANQQAVVSSAGVPLLIGIFDSPYSPVDIQTVIANILIMLAAYDGNRGTPCAATFFFFLSFTLITEGLRQHLLENDIASAIANQLTNSKDPDLQRKVLALLYNVTLDGAFLFSAMVYSFLIRADPLPSFNDKQNLRLSA